MDQTPEIIGYYAANLNSGILTVRSANPNALLFAFKNGLLGQYHLQVLVTSLDVDRFHNTPGRDYIGHQVINWWRWRDLNSRLVRLLIVSQQT